MNSFLCFVVFTSNILGSFNDPFEFDGDYGKDVNPIREYVFEQVVSKEAAAVNLTDSQLASEMKGENPSTDEIQQYRQKLIQGSIREDSFHGPTLSELIPPDLIEYLLKKQRQLENDGFSQTDLANFIYFLDRYSDQKVFSFFRHNPSELLSLDKILRDKAAREGGDFNLPILSSTQLLRGENSFELKLNLLEALFTKEILGSTKPAQKLQEAIEKLDSSFLKQYLGQDADNNDLAIFTTPAGQLFFYWLYQSLNLHLISQNEAMISEINRVKKIFANTLGDPFERAKTFRDKLIAADASVLFTQESDSIVPELLVKEGYFHSVDLQNPADGTLVLLRADSWEPSYQVIGIDDYQGYSQGRLNVILATKKNTKEKFLLASSHGNSTRAEDGRLQIVKIVERFHQLAQLPENKDLQLVIGVDANTKSEEDVQLLHRHLDHLGLMATDSGPTTVKKRMVTVQHAKAGRFAVDEEDYIIILKPENGGLYEMTQPTVGFRQEKPDPVISLPNIDNPSDHYPIGVTLTHK